MGAILSRAFCFVAIIVLGWALRRVGFFKASDFNVMSRIVLQITLPAAIVSSFSGKEIDPSMLAISLLGLGGGLAYMALAVLLHPGVDRRRERAFAALNSSGYNIGNFTLPFVQSFLGPVGVITTSLFDCGNAFVCLGGAYSVAAMIQNGEKFSLTRILRTLVKSAPFLSYMVMIALSLLHWQLPAVVVDFAGIIGGANAFMAMLMIGVGFKLSGDRSQLGQIAKILVVRYGVAALLAVAAFHLLPFGLEYRQALVLLFFSPIASAAPAFTADLKGDVGLSSAINSVSILLSIVCIVGLLLIIL